MGISWSPREIHGEFMDSRLLALLFGEGIAFFTVKLLELGK
jgi:hypothetical protein